MAKTAPKLILGSGSPRRRELLAVLGLEPAEIRAPDIDETPLKGELPRAYCMRITRAKADALPAANGEVILCADTTVALGRRILGKPADEAESRAFLSSLSGRRHQVITVVAVKSPDRTWFRDTVSDVRMKRLSEAELSAYLATGDWEGKAGGYAIQGPAGAFIPWISAGMYCLGGITRRKILDVCRDTAITAREKDFSLVDVYGADEAFVTGTFAGVTPVRTVDGRKLGDPLATTCEDAVLPGPVTTRIAAAYKSHAAQALFHRDTPLSATVRDAGS